MKLMFIVPRANGGGAEKVITALASRFAEEHEVTLVTTARENDLENYPIAEKVRCINIYDYMRQAPPPDPPSDLRQRLILGAKRAALRVCLAYPVLFRETLRRRRERHRIEALRALKRERGVECAVSFLNSANYLNAMSKAGERTIISIRSFLSGPFAPEDSQTPRGQTQIRRACELADGIVAVSREAEADLVRTYGADAKRVCTIYNICDAEKIRAEALLPAEDAALLERIERADFVVCSVGRLTEKKGHWHLVRAFRDIVRRDPKALLVILGREGIDRENTEPLLREIIRANGLENNVLLPGFYSNPYPYLARGDVYVCSSFNEGFPNALVEAMALGLPIVSTDCRSGPREILAPDTDCEQKTSVPERAPYGILLPECSGHRLSPEAPPEPEEEYLAEAIESLRADPALREHYRQQSRRRAEAFTADEIMRQWQSVILGDGIQEE